MSHEAYDRVGPFYLQYYSTQRGRGAAAAAAGPRIFRGGDRWRTRQRGDGFGSFLRGIARFLLPVVGSGISTFASHTLDAADRGVSLGDAAKSALKPTLRAVVDAGRASSSSSSSLLSQGGDGKQNFYKRMLEAKRRKRQHKRDGNDDDGGDGPPTKRRKHKRKRGSSSSSSSKPGKQQGRGGGGIVTKRRKQRGRGRGKPKKKQQQRQGGRGLSKKRVYKTSTAGSFNF